METVFRIIDAAGGLEHASYIRIENGPFMPFVIEVLPEPGPDGHPVLSIAHYGEHNGDPMRDPEILAEVIIDEDRRRLWPFYYRNDYVPAERRNRWRDGDGSVVCLPTVTRDLETFMRTWDANLRDQGFLEAFRRSRPC
jgi:hypothetical protein